MTRRRRPPKRYATRSRTRKRKLLEAADGSLLELVDHVLNKGLVLRGDLLLGVADVDLIYVQLAALLCAADRVLLPPSGKAP